MPAQPGAYSPTGMPLGPDLVAELRAEGRPGAASPGTGRKDGNDAGKRDPRLAPGAVAPAAPLRRPAARRDGRAGGSGDPRRHGPGRPGGGPGPVRGVPRSALALRLPRFRPRVRSGGGRPRGGPCRARGTPGAQRLAGTAAALHHAGAALPDHHRRGRLAAVPVGHPHVRGRGHPAVLDLLRRVAPGPGHHPAAPPRRDRRRLVAPASPGALRGLDGALLPGAEPERPRGGRAAASGGGGGAGGDRPVERLGLGPLRAGPSPSGCRRGRDAWRR